MMATLLLSGGTIRVARRLTIGVIGFGVSKFGGFTAALLGI